MKTAAKLSAYGVALVLVAGGGWAIGTAVGPFAGATGTTGQAGSHGGEDARHGDTHSGTVAEATQIDEPGGLASSKGGYTLTPTYTTLTAGTAQPFSFQITGPDGRPVTRYDVNHDQQLDLIVVRRDTAGFQHVHPEFAADGTWTVPLNLSLAGSYRAFADFTPAGQQAMTLGVDLAIPGEYRPAEYQPSRDASVDGYQLRLDGDLIPGSSSEVTLSVTKDGQPVTDLQPYLGAYGNLVALRGGDLAYLYVHPDGPAGDGITPAGPAPSTPKFRRPGPTGCSWTSSMPEESTRPSSPSPPVPAALRLSPSPPQPMTATPATADPATKGRRAR
jgi:hypothetical protein